MSYDLKYYKADSAANAYRWLAGEIRDKGKLVQTRNEWTKELLNMSVTITNPRDRMIMIPKTNVNFMLQETYDILLGYQPRSIHSKEQLEKTMGDANNAFFFGNEMRQAFSKWSLERIFDLFKKDKHTRKAILDLSTRRPSLHNPCMIYAHFIIRDNKFHMTAETRGTAISMGFIQDVFFFTVVQEIIWGWLQNIYPELELGHFLYKTVSCHFYCDSKGNPTWDQTVEDVEPNPPISLNYKQYLQDIGALTYLNEQYLSARKYEDIDKGIITTYDDLIQPNITMFNSPFFYNYALSLYDHIKTLK